MARRLRPSSDVNALIEVLEATAETIGVVWAAIAHAPPEEPVLTDDAERDCALQEEEVAEVNVPLRDVEPAV